MARPEAEPVAQGVSSFATISRCRNCGVEIRREDMYTPRWYHETPTTKGKAYVCARKHLARYFRVLVAKCKETAAETEARKTHDGYYRQDLVGAESRAKEQLVDFCIAAEDVILNGYSG